MDVRDYIRHELGQGHQILQGILADCSDEVLNHTSAGSTLGSAASIFAHIVYDEDLIVSSVAGKPMLWESDGWNEKTGVTIPGARQSADWTVNVRITPQFRDYANAVWAKSDEYVAALDPSALENKMQGPFGETTAARMLSITAYHLAQHSGEIAAIKGMRGLQGLPF
jgi:hypothetical protein